MNATQWCHRQLAWLVLFAMVFGALAPSISKLLPTSQQVIWMDLCTTQGTERVALDLNAQDGPVIPESHNNHCDYCVLQAHSPFVATYSLNWVAQPKVTNRLKLGSSGTTVFKRFVRTSHSTRAPPSFT